MSDFYPKSSTWSIQKLSGVSECKSLNKCDACADLYKPISECQSMNKCDACANLHQAITECQSIDKCEACANLQQANSDECGSIDVCGRCADFKSQHLSSPSRQQNTNPNRSELPQAPSMASKQSIGRARKPSRSKSEVKYQNYSTSFGSTSAVDGNEVRDDKMKKRPTSTRNRAKPKDGEEKPCSSNKNFDPTGKTLLYLKPKKEKNETECPPNPCESLEMARAATDARKKASDVRRKQRPKTSPEPVEEEAESEPVDDCAELTKRYRNPKDNDGLSKKYLKKKYEIEFQNYLIEKLNHELQTKTPKCRPERELSQLKHRLGYEVQKLREMVQFAIEAQRRNQSEKWGPIPISSVDERKYHSYFKDQTTKLVPPQTPSGTSLVSGFSELENSMMEKEKEECLRRLKEKAKQTRIQELCKKVQLFAGHIKKLQTESSGSNAVSSGSFNDETDCETLFDMTPKNSSASDVNCQLQAVDESINHVLTDVKVIKTNFKKLREKFNKSKPTTK